MRQPKFDYKGAINEGYTDEEISGFLREKHPSFDYEGAVNEGYSPQEINEFLSTYKKPKSTLEKGARIAGQYLLGAAESALLPYEIGVAPLASKEAQNVPYRESVGEDIENLLMQKQAGIWSPEDEAFLQNLQAQMQDPEKSKEFVQAKGLGIRDIAEDVTGLDLQPEGVLEKAAGWAGIVKNPKKWLELGKQGLKLKDAAKIISPTGSETLRGLGAGTALQMAENGNLGPVGTMVAAVVGDLAGGGAAGALKIGKDLITAPKETLAKYAAKFTSKEKLDLQKQIIEDFRKSGLTADLGTLTDNNLIKWTQARLAQSGLAGKALDDFKAELTDQIKNEYRKIADNLGEAKYASQHEAGDVIKKGITSIRDADLVEVRNLYANAGKALKDSSRVETTVLARAIDTLERQLKPGKLKAGEQQAVLNALSKIKKDIQYNGVKASSSVKDLVNNKIALNDIINYEVQGGAKQLLKGVVGDLDRAIISYGKQDPTYAKNFINANKRFSEHAKTFRNKEVKNILSSIDPATVMNKMNTVQGIRTVGNILGKTAEGREIFKNLKRLKLDKTIGDNLVDSTSQQAKLGTFSKLLEKGKNKEVIKEILGKEGFGRLQRLQANSGKLADASQKFYNASKSGAVAADAAIIAKALGDIGYILAGNPWPLMKTVASVTATRKLSQLLADKQFLRLVEDAIIAADKGTPAVMNQSIANLKPYLITVYQTYKTEDNQQSE